MADMPDSQASPAPTWQLASSEWPETPRVTPLLSSQTPAPPSISITPAPDQLMAANPPRTRLGDTERTEIIRWCVAHQDRWRDPQYKREDFWGDLSQFIKTHLDRDINYPSRVVMALVRKHRRQRAELVAASGVTANETDLSVALDEWVEIVDDTMQSRENRRQNRSQATEQRGNLERERQAEMIQRRRSRKRRRQEDSSDSSEYETVSDENENENPGRSLEPQSLDDPLPASDSRASSNSRNQRSRGRAPRSKREADTTATTLSHGISTALGAFGDKMIEAIRHDQEHFERLEARQQEVQNEVRAMNDRLGRLLDIMMGNNGGSTGRDSRNDS